MGSKNSSQKRYPAEMRERAVRMVETTIAETGERCGAWSPGWPRQLGIGEETLRNWVKRADVDVGRRDGTTSDDRARIAELERENRELKRANAILRSASAFFAAELDRPPR
jgi:transposase